MPLRPVMADVARHAGVSLGTVSNVLNNPQIVAGETRDRVQQAISDLGYIRNKSARSLVKGHPETIGFVIVDVGNSFFLDIARGVEEELDHHGFRILLANSDVDQSKQDGYIALFEETTVAGLLLAPLDGPLDAARAARAGGLPVVQVNWPGDGDSCGVVADEELGGYIAAQHLLERGRKRLAFAGGPFTLSAIDERLRGARHAVAEVPGATLETLETPRITVRGGIALGEELLQRSAGDRPDGLVSASDALGSGAIQVLRFGGVSVPEDMAVVGYDNNHFSHDSPVPMTSVGQPGHDMGVTAARMLLEEIFSPRDHRHRTVKLEPALFERQSSPPPTS